MMGKNKKKIVIPDPDEVNRYGGAEPQESDAPTGESEPSEAPSQQEAPPETSSTDSEGWKDKFLRAKAEGVNFQRRVEREREDAIRYAVVPFARALLPILDDLERVIESGCSHPDNAQAIIEGIQLTLANLLKALRDVHVVPIEAEGTSFDPHVHEAMMEQPSDEHAERVVLQVLQKGYILHDRVLRPAKVIVSRPTGIQEDDPQSPEAGEEGVAGPTD
jgi:molecular chaperone GrpE